MNNACHLKIPTYWLLVPEVEVRLLDVSGLVALSVKG